MMDLKCVVIDDEQYAVDALVRYIGEMPGLVVEKTFTSSLAALQSISAADGIDFVFLDIEMPGLSGLELAESLRPLTRFLIFTTNHAQHSLEAFGVHASHFLLKPVSFRKFATAIHYLLKSTGRALPQLIEGQKGQPQFIKADHKNAFHYIDPKEITFVEANRNYVHIHTGTETFTTHLSLSQMEAALEPAEFIRINKSFIIAKKAIRKIEGNRVTLRDQRVLPIGETYRAAFIEFVKENLAGPH